MSTSLLQVENTLRESLGARRSPNAILFGKSQLQPADEAIHSWYRFVLGYPPQLRQEYLKALEAAPERDWVLDPFCTGTLYILPIDEAKRWDETEKIGHVQIAHMARPIRQDFPGLCRRILAIKEL